MDKKTVGFVIVIILLVAVVAGMASTIWAKDRIAEVRLEQLAFKTYKESVDAVVSVRDSLVRMTEITVDSMKSEADSLREILTQSEAIIERQRLTIRSFDSFDVITDRFAREFPLISDRAHVTEYAPLREFPEETLNYIMIPTASLTTFLDQKQELAQRSADTAVVSALDEQNVAIIQSKDSIITLVKANQATLQQAFDTTSTLFNDRTDELIAELNRPQLGVGLGIGGLGGLLVGVLLGALVAGN